MNPEVEHLLARALGLQSPELVFPWQKALCERFLAGDIPAALDIPTGLGKTAVMAIWLVARAAGAPLPRRLTYVVDRRAVVDQATEVAEQLRTFVDGDANLKARLGLERPLSISTLRGQYIDNRDWLADPAAPAIIVGTVDMVGSRLLFEGYGVSRKMRPYHAAMLGADTLLVLDEAHLVPPFEHLLRGVATEPALEPRGDLRRALVPRFRILGLSATGRSRDVGVFRLTPDDFEHRVVRKRLRATKSLETQTLEGSGLLETALAERAWALCGHGALPVRVLVYADRREAAKKARDAVEVRARGDSKRGVPAVEVASELFVGGRRVFERERAKQRLEELGFLACSTAVRAVPTFVFATSAGEVGVDLDADHMVCDLVSWERMVQRLGRVNRRGDGEARVVVVVESDAQATKRETPRDKERADDSNPSAGERLAALTQLRKDGGGRLDGSPDALLELKERAAISPELQDVLDAATTPEPLRPALTRAVVDAWSLTSLREHPGRPAVEPWLRGWVDDPPQTTVVWRTHLPVEPDGRAPFPREVERYFEAAPPHASERLETETFRVAKWSVSRAAALLKGRAEDPTTGASLGADVTAAFLLGKDGSLLRSFTLEGLAEPGDKKRFETALVGGTLVLDARLGGLDTTGLLDSSADGVASTVDDGASLDWERIAGFRVRCVEAEADRVREAGWRERERFAIGKSEDGEVLRWLVVEKWRDDAATEDDRSASRPQLLETHQSWAERRARQLAGRLALPTAYVDLIALAARLHDEGKRAVRWQRAFNAPRDAVHAKTEGPLNVARLDGYRHEFGSLLRIERDERVRALADEDRDLLLHLVAAHHGFARPVIGTSGCEDAPPSSLEATAAAVALRFARLQRDWGPWGLAWLESLLRAADQQASRDNEDEGPAEGGA